MLRDTDQIDATLANLNKIVDGHYAWLVTLFASVADKSIEHSPDAYDCCTVKELLQALNAVGPEDAQCLQVIHTAHSQLHESGHNLLASIRENTATAANFNDFKNSLQIFSTAVQAWKSLLLNRRSALDPLTGLPGRRLLDEIYAQQLAMADGQHTYMLLLDLDRFKKINDSWGHLVGDEVLRALAQRLRDEIRTSDTAYRYGGEEFIILLRAPTDKGACQTALRLCEAIAQQPIQYQHLQLFITVTLGVTRVRFGETLEQVEARADAAMYRGKQTGRNRCMFMDETGEIRQVTD